MPTTQNHVKIQEWAKTHDAYPALVKTAESDGEGLLRFDFGEPNEDLERIGWDKFFEIFDGRGLELAYDDKPGSRFHKFAYPEGKG